MTTETWRQPPRERTPGGAARRIGVELEFAGLGAEPAARVVGDLMGGALTTHGPHRISIERAALGDFLVELDFAYVHGGDPDDAMRRLAGDLGAALLPMEVVCPPVTLADAPRIDALRAALREAGALGTFANPFYALGAQLNPELPSHEPDYVLSVLRAYVLLRDWLRAEIRMDVTRQIWSFAAPFPTAWCDLILDPAYAPDLTALIDDYLRLNPSRNREVDMLPLFAHLDEARVRAALPNETIKSRPTYHYRLPNTMIDAADWTLAQEWNRWVAVEELAERADLIERYSALWREHHAKLMPGSWLDASRAVRALL